MRSHNCIVLALMVAAAGLILLSDVSPGIGWEQFTTADGLIQDNVLSLYASADGSIWIGMDWYDYFRFGLNQYIGGELLTWDESYDFRPVEVYGICEDAQGTIWCCSDMTGCGFLEEGLWHKGFALNYRTEGLCTTQSGIACGPDGRLWAGFRQGIMRHDPLTGEGQQVWTSPWWLVMSWVAPVPRYLFVSSDGHIWFSSYFCPEWQPCIYEIDDAGNVLRTFLGRRGTVVESPDGTIWLGRIDERMTLTRGIERLEGNQFVYAGPPEGYPAFGQGPIFISRSGELLSVGGCDTGPGEARIAILTFDGENWAYYPCPFESVSIEDVLIDSHGDIWVGTRGTPSQNDRGLWVLHRDQSAPGISLDIVTNESNYPSGDLMRVSIDLVAEGEALTADLYLALEMPSGDLLFYPDFGTSMRPFLLGVHLPADTHLEGYELFSLTLPDLPAGTYHWFAACTNAGTLDFASNIASCEWQFVK